MSSHRDYGISVIQDIAASLKEVATRIPESFDQIVNIIINRPKHSRILFCGVGKAGFVGMKLAATFSSVGLSSFFLHPSEVSHGDLGCVQNEDIIIILSNSGETEEVVRLVQPFRELGALTIAITANTDSTLAGFTDYVISYGSVKEAGHNNLAPTSSVTVMIAIGDAIAMSAARALKFSQFDFGKYHPGGSLGRALLPIRKVMRTGEYLCIVSCEVLTRDVIKTYAETPGRPGAAIIVDNSGTVMGIFTDGNLRRLICSDENRDFLNRSISSFMSKSPKTINVNLLIRDALDILSMYQIDQLIVADDYNRPVGLIDIQDVARVYRGIE
jgi:arabinose-5-phosphate isomerase